MNDRFSVKDKVVLVTGAARGSGKAIAAGFIDGGSIVYFMDVLAEVKSTVAALNSSKAHPVVCDLKDAVAIETLVTKIIEREQRVDVLINNAAVAQIGDDENSYALDSWESIIGVNLNGTFRLTSTVLGHMKKAKSGVIINVTSPAAERAFAYCPIYSIAKAGLRQLTKAIAKDYAHCNVRANNICPGYMKTAMTKKSYGDPQLRKIRSDRIMMERWGEPEDLAGPCIFLASAAAGYITGCDLYVDGGLMAQGL